MGDIEKRVGKLEKDMKFQKALSSISGTTVLLLIVLIEVMKRRG